MADIDDRALDSMAVAPAADSGNQDAGDQDTGQDAGNQNSGSKNTGDAGSDKSIARRLEKNPDSQDARLDNALDESMDASDPPSSTQPVHSQDPAPSSGYDEAAEKARRP